MIVGKDGEKKGSTSPSLEAISGKIANWVDRPTFS